MGDSRRFEAFAVNAAPRIQHMLSAVTPNERSFQELSLTCNLSLLSIPQTEKYALKRPDPLSESYKGNTLKSEIFVKIIFPELSVSLFQQPYF